MNSTRHTVHTEPGAGFNVADLYFVLFRHKWKILIFTVMGFIAATVYYFAKQPPYQSDAKLLIRYITDTRDLSPTENNAHVISLTDLGDSIINSELEILSTLDLAAAVATNIGPERILAKIDGGKD